MIKGKKVILGLLCLLFTISIYGSDTTKVDTSDLLIKTSMQYIGVPYRWAHSDPKKGFDCSGFTSFIYRQYGYTLSRSAVNQYRQGEHVKHGEWRKGDLVFFKGRKSSGVGHVGMIVHVNDDGTFNFIHSANRGVRIDNSKLAYYKKRYIGVKRILKK